MSSYNFWIVVAVAIVMIASTTTATTITKAVENCKPEKMAVLPKQ